MNKLKKISILLIISIIFSSMPFSVSAIQYQATDAGEQVEVPVVEDANEEKNTEDINTEEASTEETTNVVPEDNFSEELKKENIQRISASTLITIPQGKGLLLGEGGKYKFIEGTTQEIPMDLDWNQFDGEYDENTSVTFNMKTILASATGLEHSVAIGSIRAQVKNGSELTIMPGSNIEINAGNEPGIEVYELTIGSYVANTPGVKLKISTNSVGILTQTVNATSTDLEVESKMMGISTTFDHSGGAMDGYLDAWESNIKVRSTGVGIPAIYLASVILNGSEMSVVSEHGTGIIAVNLSIYTDSVLEARSINAPTGKGIEATYLNCQGDVVGVAENGTHGIRVLAFFTIMDPRNGEIPRVTGEAKTGHGILIEPEAYLFPFKMGILTGKVSDGIGIEGATLEFDPRPEMTNRSQLIGIAEKGYGIRAKSININGDNWDVIGKAKQASDSELFTQEAAPPAAGILVTDDLKVTTGGATIEGVVPIEVVGSYGIFVGLDDSSNGLLELSTSDGNTIDINATGDTGIRADQIQITEADSVGMESPVLITAKGTTAGIKTAGLNISGQSPEIDSNAYRIKATAEHGSGIEIISKTGSPIELYGTSIEATGKLYGIYIEGSAGAVTLSNVNIIGSQIIAQSEQYGWFSKDVMVKILASDGQLQNGISMVEASGAEVGMKVTIDQDKYQVDGPLIEIKGESVRSSAILKAVAKKAAPDKATHSALDYDKVVVDVPDGINRGVLVDCGMIIEEYHTKAEQPITTTPVWPYAMGLNMGNGMNYEWTLDSDRNGISFEKMLDGIKLINGKGDANLVISREGNADSALFEDEPIVLLGSANDNSRATTDSALHQVVLGASFGVPAGGGGGGGSATTSTEPENPSTEASTGTEATTSGSTSEDGNKPETTEGSNGNNNTGTKPNVPWNNGRPNTGDSSIQYLLTAYALLSILSGAYIAVLYRKKNKA